MSEQSGEPYQTVAAPWTREQVKALDRWQAESRGASLCPDRDLLRASDRGWFCVNCGYTQDWAFAHQFSLAPTPEGADHV